MEIKIPDTIYTDDKACGEFLIELNIKLSKVSAMEKAIKEARAVAEEVMLNRLEATGLKNFAFDFGTFAKRTSKAVSFPKQEDGGKEKAAEWLNELVSRGLIDIVDVLNIQQARVVTDPILELEEMVANYNEANKFTEGFEPIPDSPFNVYETVKLTVPRKFKS